MKRLFLTGIAALAVAILSGCIQDRVETKEQKFMTGSLPLPEYAPLERYKLEINLVGKRELVAGEDAVLRFAIRNVDTLPVRIPEWYANEPDNILLYCQLWLQGTDDPDEDSWILLEPIKSEQQQSQPDFRFPLELAPENQVVIDCDFRVVRPMKVNPGSERRFFVKAKLNLNSVQVESPVFAVSVHSSEDEAKLIKLQKKRQP